MDPVEIMTRISDKNIIRQIFNFGAMEKKHLLQKVSAKIIQKWFRKYRKINPDSYSGMIRIMFLEYTDEYMFRYPAFAVYKMRAIRTINNTSSVPNFRRRSDVRRWILTNLSESDLAYIGI